MNPDAAKAAHTAQATPYVDELTERWHRLDCGCSVNSCPVAVDARLRAGRIADIQQRASADSTWWASDVRWLLVTLNALQNKYEQLLEQSIYGVESGL